MPAVSLPPGRQWVARAALVERARVCYNEAEGVKGFDGLRFRRDSKPSCRQDRKKGGRL